MKKVIAIWAILLFVGIAVAPSITSQNPRAQGSNNGMRIDFFEEFPTEENLNKARLIDFPSTIYIAAGSLDEYKLAENTLHEINPTLETGYWPVLEKSYFISPFSYTYELENLIDELKQNNQNNKKLKVLLDLEIWPKSLIRENICSFHKNKQLIKQIFLQAEDFNIELYTGENPAPNRLTQKFYEVLGISYSLARYPHKVMVMYYSKMIGIGLPSFTNKFINNSVKRQIVYNSKRYGEDFQVALGIIALGISGNESQKYVISPEILDRDLGFLADNGIKTAVIYRLGGLNESYINVIKKYV